MIDQPVHIVALKKALQRMYANGYDAACDAIEDTLSERNDLLKRVAELEMVCRDRDYWMTKYQTDITSFKDEGAHLRAMNQRMIEALSELAPIKNYVIFEDKK